MNHIQRWFYGRFMYIRDLAELTELMLPDPAPDSPKGRRLIALAERMERYEKLAFVRMFGAPPP